MSTFNCIRSFPQGHPGNGLTDLREARDVARVVLPYDQTRESKPRPQGRARQEAGPVKRTQEDYINMRNRTRIAGVAALAVAGVFAAVGTASAVNATQTIDGTIAPSKLPKKKFRGASVNIAVSTDTDPAGGALDPTTRAVIDFDNSIKFTTKGMKVCKRDLNGLSAAEALARCKKAKVGAGSAIARVGTTDIPDIPVNAFNAPKNKILLHADVPTGGIVLIGKLKNSQNEEADYGKALVVRVPELPPGAAIHQFQTKVKKRFTVRRRGKRKRVHYVSAKCKDRTLNYAGEFFFQPTVGDPYSLTATDTQQCTRA